MLRNTRRILLLALGSGILGSGVPPAECQLMVQHYPRPPRPNRVSVKDFGALGDARLVHDGVVQSGSPILASDASQFSSDDTDKSIYILGAGANAAPLDTKIASVTDAAHVRLADAARTTVSNASVTVGTDDLGAIQTAIATMGQQGGGTVYFPSGIYRITSGLQVDTSGLRLTGDGANSVLFISNLVLYPNQQTGANSTMDGGWGPRRAIDIGKIHDVVSNIEIDHLQVKSNGDDWIHSSIGQSLIATSPTGDFTVRNFRLHDVTLTSINFGLFSNGGILDGFSIYHNTMGEVAKEGIYLAGTSSNGIVENNQISTDISPSISNIGIEMKNSNNVQVRSNTITGAFWLCIGGGTFPLNNIVIEKNMCSFSDSPNVADGIGFDHANNMVVSDNVIEGYRAYGITFRGQSSNISNVRIINNVIRDGRGGAAISIVPVAPNLDDSPSGVAIINNVLSENPSGIEAVNLRADNIVSDNTISATLYKNSDALRISLYPGATLTCSNNYVINYRPDNTSCW